MGALPASALAPAPASAEESVREVGTLTAPVKCETFRAGGTRDTGPCPMVVDPVHNLGFVYGAARINRPGGGEPDPAPAVHIFDLARLTEVGMISYEQCSTKPDEDYVVPLGVGLGGGNTPCGVLSAAGFDTDRQMIWTPSDKDPGLTRLSAAWCGLLRYDYENPTEVQNRAIRYDGCAVPPCVGGTPVDGFFSTFMEGDSTGCNLSVSPVAPGLAQPLEALRVVYDAEHGDDGAGGRGQLYLAGSYGEDGVRRPAKRTLGGSRFPTEFAYENLGQALVIRQLGLTPQGYAFRKFFDADGAERRNFDVPVPTGLKFNWDLDLRTAGCGRRVGYTLGDPDLLPFVARVGDNLVAYCWDARPTWFSPFGVGEQGYLVRIPLDPTTGRPIDPQSDDPASSPDASLPIVNYRYVRTPTLSGYVEASVDPASGLVLLITDGKVNGNAVWLFDPNGDRFVGVSTGGIAEQPEGNTAVGVDQVRGRVYLLTRDGLLMVPSRTRPLSGGLLFPVAQNATGATDFVNNRLIAVAPGLNRLFIPINFPDQELQGTIPYSNPDHPARYLVVEDAYPEDPLPPDANPDDNTTQVDEEPGVTEVSARGQATASGAHVIVVGGVVRTIDQTDPACRTEVRAEGSIDGENPISVGLVLEPEQGEVAFDEEFFAGGHNGFSFRDEAAKEGHSTQPFAADGCLADQAANPGHREVFVGATRLEVGSGAGAAAQGAPLTYGSNDVTGEDVKSAGSCERGPLTNVGHQFFSNMGEDRESFESGYAEGCEDFWNQATGRTTDPETGEREDVDPANTNPDPRDGATGRDGRGFPLPAARCGDYGGAADTIHAGGDPQVDGPLSALHASVATCNADAVKAGAESKTNALVIPDPTGAPLVSVAKVSSRVASAKGTKGQVTVAVATAEGVRIGPLAIRELRSVAVTTAKGRTGTAKTAYYRWWCGVAVHDDVAETADPTKAPAEAVPGQGCVNPDTDEQTQDLIASLNQALPKLHLGLPLPNSEEEADDAVEAGEDSPGGYQAVLVKDPDTRGGDQAVNDDETYTVPALEAIVYNDGSRGRNRLVVQLAGVHAESRYGITPIPDFGGFGGGGDTTTTVDDTTATTEAAPTTETTDGGFVPAPPEEYFEEFGDETVRTVAARPFKRSSNPVIALLQTPAEILKRAIELLVNHPREFALLFATWALLAGPGYLMLRRRTFAKTLMAARA